MEGLSCSRDDVLDLIEEICRIREYANLPQPKGIPSPVQPQAALPELPWDQEPPFNH